MDLLSAIKKTPLYRPIAFPYSYNNSLVCYGDNYKSFPVSLLNHIVKIYVIFHTSDFPDRYEAEGEKGKKYSIPIYQYDDIKSEIGTDIIFYHPEYEFLSFAGCGLRMINQGFKFFYMMMPIPYNSGITTTHIPGYYLKFRNELERVYSLLADEQSKKVFASRIRAIESGSTGYVEISSYHEYFHPQVHPKLGDYIIDGGVSESVGAQKRFIEAVGDNGKIYGFEPDPAGFDGAKKNLGTEIMSGVYTLIPLGLWSRKGKVSFQSSGQGSHITMTENNSTIPCDVTSIDQFVNENEIHKIDFIKLDVEGSEIETLKGAIQTISKFKPNLAISLYHHPHHLFYIPIFLNNLEESYKFYIGHHQTTLHETILYGIMK